MRACGLETFWKKREKRDFEEAFFLYPLLLGDYSDIRASHLPSSFPFSPRKEEKKKYFSDAFKELEGFHCGPLIAPHSPRPTFSSPYTAADKLFFKYFYSLFFKSAFGKLRLCTTPPFCAYSEIGPEDYLTDISKKWVPHPSSTRKKNKGSEIRSKREHFQTCVLFFREEKSPNCVLSGAVASSQKQEAYLF